MEEIISRKLSNGMKVFMEKRDLPVVVVSIINKFGAIYEKEEEKGFAHFIEHLLFTGTKTRSQEEIAKEVEKKGGIVNAFTDNEVTAYWFKLPSRYLIDGLNIITDMVKNPSFDKEKFEKEKKVIIEEIKMYHDNPRGDLTENKLYQALFDKPFGFGILGKAENIMGAERDKIVKFYEKHYLQGEKFVVVVGNADFEQICEFFEKNFEKSEKGTSKPELKNKNGKIFEERAGIDQANFIVAMHAPRYDSEEYIALRVLDAYLAEGMSSKLWQEVREKRGLAYAIRSFAHAEEKYSYYGIYVGTTKDKIKEVEELIIGEFKKISEIKEKDLGEAKQQLIGLREVSSEESSTVMETLVMHLSSGAEFESYYEFKERVKKVALEEVKSIAKKLISEYSTAAIVPK